MSKMSQVGFEVAVGQAIILSVSEDTKKANEEFFSGVARNLLEGYRKTEFEMKTAQQQLSDLKNRGEKGCLKKRTISKSEVIEAMCHPGISNDCERVQTSNISDPTSRVALNYEKEFIRLNAELNDEHAFYEEQVTRLEERCREKASIVEFIKKVISQMDEKTGTVARMAFMEGKSWDEIADALDVRSHTTVRRLKEKAVLFTAKVLEERENNKIRFLME